MKTIAGIQFTDTGIVMEKPFVTNDKTLASQRCNEELFTGKFVEIARRIIKYRMAHCYKTLHAHLAEATRITKEYIAWEGGHFSIPVWQELEKALYIKDVRDLTVLQTQQIIRAIMFNCSSWLRDHDTTNWQTIGKDDIMVSTEFKTFITEHILAVKWNTEVR